MDNTAFIIGSQRSGTTILEHILGSHQDIADWYEPYYVWEKFFPSEEDDIWELKYLDDMIKQRIQREFEIFRKKSKKKLILDKTPTHVFNISIIHNIFPKAKWIHILRDGRDVTLSINKEWNKRKQIVKKKDLFNLFKVAHQMLKFQPFFRYKCMAILFELRSNATLNPLKYLNKSKWKGNVGWGARFKEWGKFLEKHSEVEFNAMQWVKSVEAAQQIWPVLPDNNKLEIRYEYLLSFPLETIKEILDFLEIKANTKYLESVPELNSGNLNKWKEGFTPLEIEQIKPILNPWLKKLGYVDNDRW